MPIIAPITSTSSSNPSRIDSGRPDEEDLHLRHQPGQHAEPEIEQQPEDQKRRGELNADAECRRDDSCHVLRRVAHERQFARRKDRVAVIHRHDHQVMEIGGKHQRNTEHGQKISDQRALFVLGRIDGRDEAQTQLLCDDGSRVTCSAEIASRAVKPSTAPTINSWNSRISAGPNVLRSTT